MFARRLVVAAASLMLVSAASPAEVPAAAASSDISGDCGDRDGWSDPAPPAHIYGNSWYVGTCGITVVLVETADGLVLLDSGPDTAVPHVLANIRALGFDPAQIKWLLVSHEHFDHAGGIAELQRITGARLAVGPFAEEQLRTGKALPGDPQAAVLANYPMEPARVDRVLANGEALTLGGVSFTALATPTHAPGSTSWYWDSCDGADCRTIAYADSLNTISADGYRYSDNLERVIEARMGLVTVEFMPCDILVTPHPAASNLLERLSGATPLAYPDACIDYAVAGRRRLAQRLAREEGKE